jgi:hypothetical protein
MPGISTSEPMRRAAQPVVLPVRASGGAGACRGAAEGLAVGLGQPIGQGHMEQEAVEHVRVAVGFEQFELTRIEAGRGPALPLRRGERGSKAVEVDDDAPGEIVEGRTRRLRHQGQELAEPGELQSAEIDGRVRRRPGAQRPVEIAGGEAGGQGERRLQRGVEAIAAGRMGQGQPVRRVEAADAGVEHLSGQGVPAEPGGGAAPELAAHRRGEVDGVALGHDSPGRRHAPRVAAG